MLNGWLIGIAFAVATGFLLARPLAVHRRSTHAEHDLPNGQIYHLDPAIAGTLCGVWLEPVAPQRNLTEGRCVSDANR